MKKQYLLFILLSISIFIFQIGAVAARQYDENYFIDNSYVDGKREDFYELQYNKTDKIYFAYSSVRYTFYIESTENITKIQINSTEFTGNITGNNVCVFDGFVAEIVLNKSTFGIPLFYITINDHPGILLDPLNISNEPAAEGAEKGKSGIDFVVFLKYIFTSPGFYMFLFWIFALLMDLQNHPELIVMGPEGKKIEIGKFIFERNEPSLNKHMFLFQDKAGFRPIYASNSFREFDQFLFNVYYYKEWNQPFLSLIKMPVPEGAKVYWRIPSATHLNTVILFFMRIFRWTAFHFITKKLYDSLNCVEIAQKEIEVLVPQIQMDALEYRFSVTYENREMDEKTGTMVLCNKEEHNWTYSDIQALNKTDVQNLKAELLSVNIVHYPTIKEALNDKRTRSELINLYEKRVFDLEVKIMDRERQYQATLTDLEHLKLEVDEKIRAAVRPYTMRSDYLQQSFPLMLANALRLKPFGARDTEAITKGIIEFLDTSDKEKAQLRKENAELKGTLNAYGKFLKPRVPTPNLTHISFPEQPLKEEDKKEDDNDE